VATGDHRKGSTWAGFASLAYRRSRIGTPSSAAGKWLGTNRNSLYKLIHDARQRLKQALLAQGITHKDLVAVFDEAGSSARLSPEGKSPSVERIS
jgi:RNA polymerase sigma-70 factor, ECF subfamily